MFSKSSVLSVTKMAGRDRATVGGKMNLFVVLSKRRCGSRALATGTTCTFTLAVYLLTFVGRSSARNSATAGPEVNVRRAAVANVQLVESSTDKPVPIPQATRQAPVTTSRPAEPPAATGPAMPVPGAALSAPATSRKQQEPPASTGPPLPVGGVQQ